MRTYADLSPQSYIPRDKIKVRIGTHVEYRPPEKVKVHFDPEFVTPSYGNRKGDPRFWTVNKLGVGDYLFFSAGFVTYYQELKSYIENYAKEDDLILEAMKRREKKLAYNQCIFGWIKIDRRIELPRDREESIELAPENAHVNRIKVSPEEGAVIMIGDPKSSKKLERVVPLTIPVHIGGKVQHIIRPDLPKGVKGRGGKPLEGVFVRGARIIEGGDSVDNLITWLKEQENKR